MKKADEMLAMLRHTLDQDGLQAGEHVWWARIVELETAT